MLLFDGSSGFGFIYGFFFPLTHHPVPKTFQIIDAAFRWFVGIRFYLIHCLAVEFLIDLLLADTFRRETGGRNFCQLGELRRSAL